MHLWIDEYAHLDSPLHRWDPRQKFVALMAMIFAFSFVRDLRLIPAMIVLTAGLYALSQLPVAFLLMRMRYPGYFLGIMALILPFFAGQTVLFTLGPLAVYEEGVVQLALIAARFGCILTVGLVLFGTAPFLTTIHAMRSLGLPALLADMTLLTFRYLFEIADMLKRMETAMRLRGFRSGKLSRRGFQTLAALAGSILIRSFEQSERVYKAMKLRGYGSTTTVTADRYEARSNGQHADAAPAPILSVSGLCFGYPSHPDVLHDLSFSIASGARVGLIGPNGAGKTSLFLAIAGVLKASAGDVRLGGESLRYGKFHPEIGLVFQNADDQLFSPTVRDDVAFGPVNMGLPEAEIAARVQAALATVGALDLADRPPHHLSGGEKRMVAIAGILALHPRVIMVDEPDANLDVRARRRLIRFLQASEQTLLVASHDLELILEVCERVLLLDEGCIVADGDPCAIMGDDALMEAHGLEKPHSLIPHAHGIPCC